MPGGVNIDPIKAGEAQALSQVGYTGAQIAAETGLNRRTVYDIIAKHGRWAKIERDKPVFAKLRAEQNLTLEVAYRAAAARSLQLAFDEEKLAKASYYQLVLGSSIAIDKAQLLAGLPTEITANLSINIAGSIDQLAARLAETLTDVPRETNDICVDKTDVDIPAEET